jgi:regulator of protease activity HflC (stomatin/prohibitin superfamily)
MRLADIWAQRGDALGYGESKMKLGAVVTAALAAILALTVALGSWYTIDQRERGVILRNGAIAGVASPGLNFKLPIIDTVQRLSLETKVLRFEKMHTYSRDQQPAIINVSVNHRIPADQVAEIYARFGSEKALADRLVTPRVLEETKTVFGRFNAVTAIQERGRLNAEVQAAIAEAVKGPVIIEGVQIENIDFSTEYEKSIEQRMLAEVEVQKLKQNAEREKVQAEITVTKAKAQADAVLAQAKAEADAIRLRGEAEASAIRARAAALADNPALVSLVQAERWDGKLPSTMVPSSSLPMLTLNRP